jgi:hypothetical protein
VHNAQFEWRAAYEHREAVHFEKVLEDEGADATGREGVAFEEASEVFLGDEQRLAVAACDKGGLSPTTEQRRLRG